MKVVFVDTDVMLDYLLKREPFFDDALRLMRAGLRGEVKLFISVITVANLIYFLRKKFTVIETRQKLKVLRSFVEIAASDYHIVDEMINSFFGDLEDALQYATALQVGAEVLLTRNISDYKQSKIAVMNASDFFKR
jgi:predicted nucleic acid-binding protein